MNGSQFDKALRRLIRRAVTSLESQLMPRRCAFCGVISEGGEGYICAGCFDDLPWIHDSCPRCAAAMPAGSERGLLCGACQAAPPPFFAAVAPLEYAFPVDAAIKAFKFHRRLFYVPAFAELLAAAAGRLPPDVDALLPVPLHRWRQLARGFNQALELAKPVSASMRIPLLSNVHRIRATPYQSGLTARERRRNLNGVFRVKGRLTASHVVIVDDVITSGETCRRLARLALDHGAGKVSVLALARA